MLKSETLNLLKRENINFKDLFSICIGKTYLYQRRFIDFIGKYNRWNTEVTKGKLLLDNKSFDVEYIGTTSLSDNYWYSSELETVIPDEYVNLMIQIRKKMQELNISLSQNGKIALGGEINGYNLSMIYIAFSPINVAYFKGSGNTSIYMFVKNLPDEIFKRVSNIEFSSLIMEIISTFDVNHKLMIKALLTEFDYKYIENENNLIVDFSEDSQLTIKFNGDIFLGISGMLA